VISKTSLLEIISGKRSGMVAGGLRLLLGALTPVYRLGVGARNRRFDRAEKEQDQAVVRRAAVPVVSIGNLTTGGTGKTPLVVFVARMLRNRGQRVALVSRGYGVDLKTASRNDEAMELEHRLPDVPHLQDPDRFQMAKIAVQELEAQVIVLDDGFQHRQLHRDIDIVTIDATNPFGYGRLLPRGLLREPIRNIARADFVVITRANLVAASQLDQILKRLEPHVRRDQILVSSMKLTHATQASGNEVPLDELAAASTFLFSGIGNPQGFEVALEKEGFQILGHEVFADHHAFDRGDIKQIGQRAKDLGAQQIVCTHKDLVKVAVDQIAGLPVFAAVIEVSFETQVDRLEMALANLAVGPA
jgi:tetraacyldisaccharide 4'-kinase